MAGWMAFVMVSVMVAVAKCVRNFRLAINTYMYMSEMKSFF